jgi:hypothetical protein
MIRIVPLCVACGIGIGSLAAAADPAPLKELRVGRQIHQGRLIAQDDKVCLLLGQDGQLLRVEKAAGAKLQDASPTFRPWSSAVVRDKLKREFGSGFAIVGTRHYLVCARGDKHAREYGDLFEALFASFQRYFNVRGLKLTEPEFPLVAIVFPDASAFAQYAQRDGTSIPKNLMGYYSPRTNRVALFDHADGAASATDTQAPQRAVRRASFEPFAVQRAWGVVSTDTKDTLIHEATHQLAFNMGLHNRVGTVPLWVVEGMATVFESPGIRNSSANLGSKSRINLERYVWFGNYQKSRRKPKSLEAFIAGDTLFQSNTLDAYSEAWALTFFLVETRSRQYAKYLQTISARNPLFDYPAEARVSDFKQAFGGNLALLEAEFLRFISTAIK